MQVSIAKISGKKIFNVKAFVAGATKALDDTAKNFQDDYKATYRTFTNVKPKAVISAPSAEERVIQVDNQIYRYLDFGTRPHIIRARRAKYLFFAGSGFRAKTTPGVIGSGAGSRGTRDTWKKQVNHPGTKPRKFTETIFNKRKSELPKLIDRLVASL